MELSGSSPVAPKEMEGRSWAMVAHLAFFANVWFPFSGFVAVILIYTLRRSDDAFAREHFRTALNYEITVSLFNAIAIGGYLVAFFSMFIAVARHGQEMTHGAMPQTNFLVVMAFVGAIVIVGIASAILSGFAARAAWCGRTFRYPISIPWVRSA